MCIDKTVPNDSLDYSYDGEINRIFFYTDFNSINILVEDKDKEFEYEIIFQRLFGNELSIETTFGVGGKENLKNAYYLLNDNKGDIKSINIFIADLDFDNILDKVMIKDDLFIYLDRYCIENYLIDKKAILNFIQGRLCKRIDAVERAFKYEYWFNTITNQFYDLHLLFLVVQDKNLGIPNTGESTFKFIQNESWEIDKIKFDKYYNEIKAILPDLDKEIEKMRIVVKSKVGNNISNIICGKFYFDSLKRYMLNFSGATINDKDLRNVLFRSFNISSLDFLKSSIIKIKEQCSVAS